MLCRYTFVGFVLSAFLSPLSIGHGADIKAGLAEVNGTQLYYEIAGTGPALVLLHPGSFDRRVWDDQFQAFSEHYQVIRYDVRGHGKSVLPTRPYSDTEDLVRLLQLLQVEKASFVGLSLGGRISIDFALTHPEMVDVLVLVAPGLSGYMFSQEQTLRYIQLVQAIEDDDGSPAGDLWLQSPYMVPTMRQPAVAHRLRPIARENARSWLIHPLFPRDLFSVPSAIQRLSEIQAPTLLIVGDRDQPDIQNIVHTLETEVVGAQKVIIAGAGHLVNMEKPEEFNLTVLNFLGKE